MALLGATGRLGWNLLKGGGRKLGGAAKMGTAGLVGGGIALGASSILGGLAAKGIMGMSMPKFPGAKGGGLAGGASDPAASRDSSIIAGMKPSDPIKKVSIGKLSKDADLPTSLQWIGKAASAIYTTVHRNNLEIIRVQEMLQGPVAARAKELRMESGGLATPPVIIIPGGGTGEGEGGSSLPLVMGGLASLAAMIAGAMTDPDTDILTRQKGDKIKARSIQFSERGGERAKHLAEQAAKEAERQRRILEKEQRARQRGAQRYAAIEAARQAALDKMRLGRGGGGPRISLMDILRGRETGRSSGADRQRLPWWQRQGNRSLGGDMRSGTVDWIENQKLANAEKVADTKRAAADKTRYMVEQDQIRNRLGRTIGERLRAELGELKFNTKIGNITTRLGNLTTGVGNLTRILGEGFVEVGEKTGTRFSRLNNALKTLHTSFIRTPTTGLTGPAAAEARLGGPRGGGQMVGMKPISQVLKGLVPGTGVQKPVSVAGKTGVAYAEAKLGGPKGGGQMVAIKQTTLPPTKEGPIDYSKQARTEGMRAGTVDHISAQEEAKMKASADKIAAGLPKQVKPFLQRYAQAKAASELGPKANKFVNRFFLGAIIFGFAAILWNFAFDKYDPKNEENNKAIAKKAATEMAKVLGSAIVIWSLIGVLLNSILAVVGTAFLTVPVLGWAAGIALFAGKFWLTDYVLNNLKGWLSKTPISKEYLDFLPDSHGSMFSMETLEAAKGMAKSVWSGSMFEGTPLNEIMNYKIPGSEKVTAAVSSVWSGDAVKDTFLAPLTKITLADVGKSISSVFSGDRKRPTSRFTSAGTDFGAVGASSSFLDYVADQEGFSETAYTDAAGVLTAGYGHTGSDVTSTTQMSEPEARRFLVKDIQEARRKAKSKVNGRFGAGTWEALPQHSKDMLTDIEFNVRGGLNTFQKFTKAVVTEDWETARKEYKRYYTDTSGETKPLVKRNKDFYARFLDQAGAKQAATTTLTGKRDDLIHRFQDVHEKGYAAAGHSSGLTLGEYLIREIQNTQAAINALATVIPTLPPTRAGVGEDGGTATTVINVQGGDTTVQQATTNFQPWRSQLAIPGGGVVY